MAKICNLVYCWLSYKWYIRITVPRVPWLVRKWPFELLLDGECYPFYARRFHKKSSRSSGWELNSCTLDFILIWKRFLSRWWGLLGFVNLFLVLPIQPIESRDDSIYKKEYWNDRNKSAWETTKYSAANSAICYSSHHRNLSEINSHAFPLLSPQEAQAFKVDGLRLKLSLQFTECHLDPIVPTSY